MKEERIVIKNLYKDYGGGKGIFDINISVCKGQVYGFLGPNGSGKTTTIRNLLGFIRPDKGECYIDGMDCYKDSAQIQKELGYLAGEISFLDDMTGMQMINFMAEMKGVKDKERINELIELFELNTLVRIRKMSKGMKQKLGIVCAFMANPKIILLDEPTSGLDPLMQNRFVELIMEEKAKGHTIFMSSHIFEEVEKTCDKVAIIKAGKIIAVEDMQQLRQKRNRTYILEFQNKEDINDFIKKSDSNYFQIKQTDNTVIQITIRDNVSELINLLNGYEIVTLDVKQDTLEEIFMHFYENDNSYKEESKYGNTSF